MEKKKNLCSVVAVALVICMAIALAGCANSGSGAVTDTGSSQTSEPTKESTETTETTEENPADVEATENTEEAVTEPSFDFSFDIEERPSEEEEPELDQGEDGEE